MQDSSSSSDLTLNQITGITHKATGTRHPIEDELNSSRDKFRKPLDRDEFAAANNDLNVDSFVNKFPRTFKYSADDPIPQQTYSLHSFIPSKGATPDKDGVFGMIKFRGAHADPGSANESAEKIIQMNDSYNTIFTSYVGKWFPVTQSSKWTQDVHEVDIQKKQKEVVSTSIKEKRNEEKKQINEIKKREEELRSNTSTQMEDKDPIESYLECMVKKANCLFTLERYKKDIERLERVLEESRAILVDFDEKQPELKENYKDVYRKARESVGLPISETETLIHYMEK